MDSLVILMSTELFLIEKWHYFKKSLIAKDFRILHYVLPLSCTTLRSESQMSSVKYSLASNCIMWLNGE